MGAVRGAGGEQAGSRGIAGGEQAGLRQGAGRAKAGSRQGSGREQAGSGGIAGGEQAGSREIAGGEQVGRTPCFLSRRGPLLSYTPPERGICFQQMNCSPAPVVIRFNIF